MIDITVNGTSGEVDTECRAERISGCRVCRIANMCKTCIYGNPFSLTYKVDGVKMYGLCECPSGYYKTTESVCASLADLDLEGMLDASAIASSSIEELVTIA